MSIIRNQTIFRNIRNFLKKETIEIFIYRDNEREIKMRQIIRIGANNKVKIQFFSPVFQASQISLNHSSP